jgi:hypothetical protein
LPSAQAKSEQKKPAIVMPPVPQAGAKPDDASISPKVPADQIHVVGERRHELSQDYHLYLDKLEETFLAMSRFVTRLPYEKMRPHVRPIYLDEKRDRSLQQFCAAEGIAWLLDYAFPESRNNAAQVSAATSATNKRTDQQEELLAAALNSLQTDPLRALLPFLVKFLGECYPHSVEYSVVMLTTLTAAVAALFLNHFLNIQPFIHQLIPLIATCVLRPKLGNPTRMENHWALRDFASRLLISLATQYVSI